MVSFFSLNLDIAHLVVFVDLLFKSVFIIVHFLNQNLFLNNVKFIRYNFIN
jgi:hypothetical protein